MAGEIANTVSSIHPLLKESYSNRFKKLKEKLKK